MQLTPSQNLQQNIYSIKQAKYYIQTINSSEKRLVTGAISNNLKYIVAGGADSILKIWNYRTYNLIKSLKFDDSVLSCKFTDDSKLLYVGIGNRLYQFYVNNQFRKLSKQDVHSSDIDTIYCMSNTKIFSLSYQAIIKTDFNYKKQLFKIGSFDYDFYGLDYNKGLNIIASGSNVESIKLWDGNNGCLIMEQKNHQKNKTGIFQVLFMDDNKLISLDSYYKLTIWNINYETKQLEYLQSLKDSGFNVSLVLQKQYIITTGETFIKVYTIKGEFVREFKHDVKIFNVQFNVIQLDSMKAVLIVGGFKLQVCKLDINFKEGEYK